MRDRGGRGGGGRGGWCPTGNAGPTDLPVRIPSVRTRRLTLPSLLSCSSAAQLSGRAAVCVCGGRGGGVSPAEPHPITERL